jgi:hypothetical protein
MTRIVRRPPAASISLEDCFFYHTMEIPGTGLVRGQWDLRADPEVYLGRIDLEGRRVLEIGPASGYLTFHMERRGAEVVGSELSGGGDWDLVPFHGLSDSDYVESRQALTRALHNGFWLAHQAHRSNAGVVYGSVYDLPEDLEGFDIAVFSAVLLHLRDPFQALRKVLTKVGERVVVSDMFPWHRMPPGVADVFRARPESEWSGGSREVALPEAIEAAIDALPPQMYFCPDSRLRQPRETWWQFTPSLIREFVGVLGFETERVLYHYQLHDPRYQWTKPPQPVAATYYPCFTLVARRR